MQFSLFLHCWALFRLLLDLLCLLELLDFLHHKLNLFLQVVILLLFLVNQIIECWDLDFKPFTSSALLSFTLLKIELFGKISLTLVHVEEGEVWECIVQIIVTFRHWINSFGSTSESVLYWIRWLTYPYTIIIVVLFGLFFNLIIYRSNIRG